MEDRAAVGKDRGAIGKDRAAAGARQGDSWQDRAAVRRIGRQLAG